MSIMFVWKIALVLGWTCISNAAFIDIQNLWKCPSLYLRYSTEHTYCKAPNPECNIIEKYVTDEDIGVILREHNLYRSKVALGKESINSLPSAGNMMQMEWDPELAKVAQKHAEQCQFSHDCDACRQVQNFAVGQNLYQQTIANSAKPSAKNWTNAVKSWYDEVSLFRKAYIEPFIPSMGEPTYGHFSQVVWGESWKIGCGYAVMKEGSKKFRSLYTCNYGPAGNMFRGKMYSRNRACTDCPMNSCCDKTCTELGLKTDYPGLCKMLKNEAPLYKEDEDYFFSCTFRSEEDCKYEVIGVNNWKVMSTLSGNFVSIVLNGGEESTLKFTKPLQAQQATCLILEHRQGPNVAGEESTGSASMTFAITNPVFEVSQPLPKASNFAKFSMTLNWGNNPTVFSLTFKVPPSSPAQYFEVKYVKAKEGQC